MRYLPLLWAGLFRRKTRTILTLLSIAPVAFAQNMDPAVRDLIERMQARIDGLEKRLAELEREVTKRRKPKARRVVSRPTNYRN